MMGEGFLYYLILIIAGLLSAVYLCVRVFFNDKSKKKLAIHFLVLSVLVLVAVGMSGLCSQLIYKNLLPNRVILRNEYFVTLAIFYLLVGIYNSLTPSVRLDNSFVAQGLILFSFLARFGCLAEGCCLGKSINGFNFPIVFAEMVFAVAIFAVIMLIKTKDSLAVYVLSYSVFRFLTEFLRLNVEVRMVLGVNLRQILALITIICIATSGFISSKEVGKHGKKDLEES